MNWKKEAIKDLEKHNERKKACETIQERRKALQEEMKSVGEPGEISTQLLNMHAKSQRMELAYDANKRVIALVERGLADLKPAQRQILTDFYIDRQSGYIERLCAKLHVEPSSIYRMKDAALREFTLKMYGVMEY